MRCGTPFWRVIRPTKATIGRDLSTPSSSMIDSLDSAGPGYQTLVSTPFLTTCTRSGFSAGYAASTSSRMPELTAITASAACTAVRSTHSETW